MADWRPMLKRRDDGFPRIMGVVNVTPDSFFSQSRSEDTGHAIGVATRMAAEGADWIDIGGESTRPGAKSVTLDDELARVIPAIEEIRSRASRNLHFCGYQKSRGCHVRHWNWVPTW